MNNISKTFSPFPGWIIATPYISKTQTFNSLKEEAGSAQKSTVIAIGDSFIDDHGNKRECPCKVGDVVLHQYVNDDYELGMDKYRAIKFYQVIANLK